MSSSILFSSLVSIFEIIVLSSLSSVLFISEFRVFLYCHLELEPILIFCIIPLNLRMCVMYIFWIFQLITHYIIQLLMLMLTSVFIKTITNPLIFTKIGCCLPKERNNPIWYIQSILYLAMHDLQHVLCKNK